MRCLGVPCRPVSNYWSAHDGGFDRNIDKYFEADGAKSTTTEDSIWTFHVWCDAWFARPDLGARYAGWQAIDATPQEMSGGLWQMGPAPVRAVFLGEGHIGYDTEFVIGEVNADERSWTRRADGGGWELTGLDRKKIGPFLLTRWDKGGETISLPGNMSKPKDTLDVMRMYKPEEGTKAERATLHNAPADGPPPFSVTVSPESTLLGDTVEIVVSHVGGGGPASFVVECYASSYAGREGVQVSATSAEGASATLRLSPEEYRPHLADTSCVFDFRCFATVGDTHWVQVVQTVLAVPELEVRPAASLTSTGPNEYEISFKNPLPFALGAATLGLSATRGVKAELLAGNGQQVAEGAPVTFRLAVTRTDATVRRAVVALDLDTDVLTDIPGEIELQFV